MGTNLHIVKDRGRRDSWVIFGTFLGMTLFKTILFNKFAFHSLVMSYEFCAMMSWWLPKIAAAALFASAAFILRDKRWMVLISLIVDTWIVANLIYIRNNHILLDAEAFNMSANINGYSASILVYIEWWIDLIFYAMTALFGIIFRRSKRTNRMWVTYAVVLVATVVLRLAGEGFYCAAHDEARFKLSPFVRPLREQVYGTSFPMTVANTSVLYSPLYIVPDMYLMIRHIQPERPMTEADHAMLEKIMNPVSASPERSTGSIRGTGHLDTPLIIVLLESLENWVLRPEVMPNLYRLTQSDHVFYAPRVHTQIVAAPSADGQLIVNTGMLPISAGATCLHYDHNTYPGLMTLTDEPSVCLLPHSDKVWNQTAMSPAYGYDTTICYSDIDTILFCRLNSLVDEGWRYIQCITQSTHAPFINEKYSHLELDHNMPWVMYNFIRCFNTLDNGLGYFIRKIEEDPVLQQYTIVFTGDHRILHREKREQIESFAELHHMDYNAMDDCLPLVIYSPKIEGNIRYDADCYQMDIYPTVLPLLGASEFPWQGFGIDLLEAQECRAKCTPKERPITADDAYVLSDRMIRADYFRTLDYLKK